MERGMGAVGRPRLPTDAGDQVARCVAEERLRAGAQQRRAGQVDRPRRPVVAGLRRRR